MMGRMTMNYPEQVVFLNDRNVIELTAIVTGQPNAVGGTLSLSNGNDTIQLAYNSERDNLLFDLYSALKKLAANSNVTVTVSGGVSCGDQTTNITPFTMNVIDGRTLLSHSHCAERIIYYYDYTELYSTEILTLNGGTVNGSAVSSGVSKLNLGYHTGDFNVTVVDGSETRVIKIKKASCGGDVDVVGAECDADDENSSAGYILLWYVNTDGCHRYVKGKVINRKRSVTRTQWRANELVRNTPNAMITDHTDEITLGFPNCERLAYVDDIMYSPEIWYLNADGEWRQCDISSKNLQLDNWDANDIQITIKTLA